MKILLIEDDDLDARAIERLLSRLRKLDCAFRRATDLNGGLAEIARDRPDAVFLDLGLPDAQGLEAVRRLAAALPDRPVIVLTGDPDADKDLPALAAGASDYLIKGQIAEDVLARTLRHSVERKRSEQRIREQAELLDRANEGIVASAITGAISYLNAGARALLGLEAEAAASSNLFEFLGLKPDRTEELLWRLRSDGGAETEVELPRADGAVHLFVRWSMSADSGAAPDRELIAIMADVTERQRLAARTREAQKLESLGALAGGIAHDFNNLLAAILGNVSLVKSELPATSEHWDMLNDSELAAERAAELCTQMLAYAGKGRFVTAPVDLAVLLRQLCESFSISLGRKTELTLELTADLPPVLGDAAQLKQSIANLVVNAVEAVGDAGGEIVIEARPATVDPAYLANAGFVADLPPGLYVSVSVTDTGDGMDDETLARIFDPFFSTKFTGRGLGLASVQGIVRIHDGALAARSEPGRGSTFEILLPVALEEADAAGTPTDGEAPENKVEPGGAILIVDDEEHVRSAASRVLGRLGCEIVLARGGAEAVLEFERRSADLRLVLLDLTMPHMDGVETHKLIRSIDPGVPVLIMSGYSEQAFSGRVQPGEIAGFVHKPFHAKELLNRVAAAIAPVRDR